MPDATYAWIVDVDHSPDVDAPEGTNLNAGGVMGPRNAPVILQARLKAGEGRPWRIYDDDGELYYSGRILFKDEDDNKGCVVALPEEAFGPLNDFGAPNAGATEIHYQHDGVWEVL